MDILFKLGKKIIIMLLVLGGVFFLSACDESEVEDYVVTYVFNETTKTTLPTEKGKAVKEEVPRQFRHNFMGWYLDDKPFNFRKRVTENITLVAKYNDDYENLVREIHIDLDDPSEMSVWEIEKKTYLDATLKLFNDDKFALEEYQIEIRGRGNSTWTNPKKPYRVKFPKATSILGMRKAKLYVLLADYFDPSGLRNYLAHSFSSLLNLDYTLETRFVELYFNGEYQGMYLLTEQVQIYKNRLDLTMEDNPDSGFLIELEDDSRMEGEGDEDFDWVKVEGRNYLIKYPKPKNHSEEDYCLKAAYIKNYLTEMMASFEDGTYEEYIDVSQFIEYFILQEIFKNVDVNFSSVFAHKDEGGKLKMGPLWDFDISLGNGNYFDYSYLGYWAVHHPWLKLLLKDDDFRESYQTRFRVVLEKLLPEAIDDLVSKGEILRKYFNDDNALWNTFGKSYWPVTEEMEAALTHEAHINLIKEFLEHRQEWLLNNLDLLDDLP